MLKSIIKHLSIVALWLLIWQVFAMAVGSDFLLPTVFDALSALATLVLTPNFYLNVAATFYRCIVGILLSFVLGAGTGFISYINKYFRAILALPVSFLKAVPVVAIIIYGILLMNATNVPILACFLMCYPVSYTNILSGLDHMDSQLLEMAKVYNLSNFTKIRYIFLPSLVPHIKAALSLTAGLSWKSVIAAEVLSVPIYSMGYELLESKIYFETNFLFAWVITIVALSLVFERLIKLAMGKIDIVSYMGSKINFKNQSNGNAKVDGIHDVKSYAKFSPVSIGLSNITKSFGSQIVLNNFTEIFEAGRTTALMGPSGKGKTTILRIIAGLDFDYTGTVTFSEKTIFRKDISISYLFQENRLLPWLNVYDNIALVLKGCNLGSNKETFIRQILNELELTDSIYKLPCELSGGMCHRVSMARALVYPSSILLLDEPFSSLDKALTLRITENIAPYLLNRTTVIVTHSSEDAKRLGNTVCSI